MELMTEHSKVLLTPKTIPEVSYLLASHAVCYANMLTSFLSQKKPWQKLIAGANNSTK